MESSLVSLFLVLIFLVHGSSYGLTQSRLTVPTAPKCIYFTGAGIYYYWQAGAAKYIQENCDLSNIPIVGASAGSLTSSLLFAGVNFDESTSLCIEIAKNRNLYDGKTGLVGILGELTREWLTRALPTDIDMEKFKNMFISVTPVSPFEKATLLTSFTDKADLIDACLASCHIPFFLDGKAYAVYKDMRLIDGSFNYFLTKDRYLSLPLPEGVSADEVFWVDYGDDEEFVNSISGNFVELITPDVAVNMMAQGYEFMRKEHRDNRMPIANKPYVLSNMISKVTQFPRKVNHFVSSSVESLASYSSSPSLLASSFAMYRNQA